MYHGAPAPGLQLHIGGGRHRGMIAKIDSGAQQQTLGKVSRYPGSRVLGGSSQDLDTWLITMVIVSPLSGVIPLPNGLNGLQMVVTNYLLSGMILQVGLPVPAFFRWIYISFPREYIS